MSHLRFWLESSLAKEWMINIPPTMIKSYDSATSRFKLSSPPTAADKALAPEVDMVSLSGR